MIQYFNDTRNFGKLIMNNIIKLSDLILINLLHR